MQSGKSSLTSWPDVKLIPQTNKQVYSHDDDYNNSCSSVLFSGLFHLCRGRPNVLTYGEENDGARPSAAVRATEPSPLDYNTLLPKLDFPHVSLSTLGPVVFIQGQHTTTCANEEHRGLVWAPHRSGQHSATAHVTYTPTLAGGHGGKGVV